MQYKTIVLELLQDRPEMYDKLLRERTVLASLEYYASELRDSHLTWKELLGDRKPDSNPNQIASEAMKIALEELAKHLEGQAVKVNYGGTTLHSRGTLVGGRLGALIRLHDRARRVLQSQNEG
jgi:hypothetical protein